MFRCEPNGRPREKFLEALKEVPEATPAENDSLPEGYNPETKG